MRDDPRIVLRVAFFKLASGKEPVREWLLDLPVQDRKSIGEEVKTVQFGWPLGMPLVRKLEPGLWEVRITLSRGIARVVFMQVDQTMMLLHGFIKKSQKTPKQDLELARKRKKLIEKET